MSPDEQPTIFTPPPNGSRPAPMGWQAPSVEQMQTMLPQYEIMEILGRGGMGAVYKGRQKSLKRLVAIKILPLDAADDEMKFVERFQNEAQTMAAMNHPAIVSVYDFGETPDGLLYFIMEFVDGTDVQKMIQASGKLSGEYALAITAHVCDALDYAHKRGVIHRDIKPANILIDQEGHIKVADFGLAKMDDPSQSSGLTKTNMAMGTPDYVAPEVLSPGMVADHRADLYAVGVMLYQMLTGEVPRGMFKLPSQKGIGSDPRFDEIICKAMEQDREERYQSAMEVRHALDVILTTPQPKDDGKGIVSASQIPQKPVAKQPRPPGEKSVPPQPTRNPSPPPQRGAEKKPADKSVRAPVRKSSATSTWLSIGVIVAVLGLAGFLVLGGKPKPQASDKTNNASATAPSAKPQPPIKVRENPKPTAPASSASAKGKEIDLLALVDVNRDAVAGQWVRTADGLVKTGGIGGGPRLQLPYQPPEEYDFVIEFTPTGGIGNIGQILAAQGREFGWMLNTGDQGNHRAGFGLLDGKRSTEPTETTASLKEGIVDGRRYRSRVEVRTGRLRAFLDDAEIVNWTGDFSRLANDVTGKLRDSGHIGLRLNRDAVFHKITVREITGTGKVDAGVSATTSVGSSGAPAAWTDWLGPRLAKGQYTNNGFVPEKDGITTDQGMKGTNITADDTMDGAIKLTYLLRDSKGVQITVRSRGIGDTRELYVVEDSGSGIYIGRILGNKTTMLVSEKYPATISPTGERTLEFRAEGASLVATVNGTFTVSAHDTTLTKGPSSFVIMKGLLLKKVEIASNGVPGIGITKGGTVPAAPPSPATTWTDWLAPKLASGGFVDDGWAREAGGVTTDQPIKGIGIIRDEVKDGAVRLTGLVRGGGMQITAREQKTTAGRELYVAHDTGISLYIGCMMRDNTVVNLIEEKYPAGITRDGEHTLEFRCVGSTLTATLNGTFTITTEDSTLTKGTWAIVLKRGALMKKVEIAD
jgi:serine/threonine protein kinase